MRECCQGTGVTSVCQGRNPGPELPEGITLRVASLTPILVLLCRYSRTHRPSVTPPDLPVLTWSFCIPAAVRLTALVTPTYGVQYR